MKSMKTMTSREFILLKGLDWLACDQDRINASTVQLLQYLCGVSETTIVQLLARRFSSYTPQTVDDLLFMLGARKP